MENVSDVSNISDLTTAILNEIDRQWSQAKQSEDQRLAISNFIVVIAVAAQGFIVEKDFPRRALVLAVSLVVLGLFGAIASAKYYERFRMSMTRVGRLRERLDELHPDLKLDETEQRADRKHAERYPRISRLRLHLIWRFLMLGIAVVGGYDIYVILRYGR
jgi:hypothetical protein